jgi:DnaJ-class molecular chaperone
MEHFIASIQIPNSKKEMTKKIKCAFCNGTGKDPFELLSPISDCLVCSGTGNVEVMEPIKKCIFCAGTGQNPLGSRVACIVCGGKGSIYISGNNICPQCKGTGKSGDGLPCSRCNGKAII